MIARKALLANAALAVALSYPQMVSADEFTGADLLKWTVVQQDSFFRTSITMMSIVAMRTGHHDEIVSCINEWYGTEALQAERHEHIRSVLIAYPDFHPQGVILAVVEKVCGPFERN